MDFFLPWLPRYRIFSFFQIFNSVAFIFIQNIWKFWKRSPIVPGTRICQFFFYDICNRFGNITKSVFVFFNTAPLQCTAFLGRKATFWFIH